MQNICLVESKIILHKFFFHQTCVQTDVMNGKLLVKCLNHHQKTNHEAIC